VLAVLGILVLSSGANADRVYFKDGRIVNADHCLKEGDVISCSLFGGFVSFSKDEIEKIEENTPSRGPSQPKRVSPGRSSKKSPSSDPWTFILSDEQGDLYAANIQFKTDRSESGLVEYEKKIIYRDPLQVTGILNPKPPSITIQKSGIDCDRNTFHTQYTQFFTAEGDQLFYTPSNVRGLPKARGDIKSGTFESAIHEAHCNQNLIATVRDDRRQAQEAYAADYLAQREEAKRKEDDLKGYLRDLVGDYGEEITSIVTCGDRDSGYKKEACDYVVWLQTKVIGDLPSGVISGLAPVFYHKNRVMIKNHDILDVKTSSNVPDVLRHRLSGRVKGQ
jgi:hypothetical protein